LQRSPNLLQADLPPGALVTLLQKALLFSYVESHVTNDGKPIKCEEVFSLLKPHDHDHGPIESAIVDEGGDVTATKNSTKRQKTVQQSNGGHNSNNGTSSISEIPVGSPDESNDPVRMDTSPPVPVPTKETTESDSPADPVKEDLKMDSAKPEEQPEADMPDSMQSNLDST
jgi:hypothetical protein